MLIAAAATAAPTLEFATGIAVAFPRSPMVSAAIAWELAQKHGGRFRLGLGSQVQGAHRAPLRRRVRAARPADARLRAGGQGVLPGVPRRGEARATTAPTTSSTCCRAQWAPPRHAYGDIKVDISAVGP